MLSRFIDKLKRNGRGGNDKEAGSNHRKERKKEKRGEKIIVEGERSKERENEKFWRGGIYICECSMHTAKPI